MIDKEPTYLESKSINWRHKVMNSVEDYTTQWSKSEKEDTLSQWIKNVRSLIQIIVKKKIKKKPHGTMSTSL